MTGNIRLAHATARRLLVGTLALVLLLPALASAGPEQDAKKAAEARRWAEAADAWAQVLDKRPGNRDAALALADTAVRAARAEHYQAAEDALRGLLETKPEDVALRVALGRICLATSAAKEDTLAKKSYDVEAKQSFERALKADPKADAAAAGLAQTYYQMGDFANAVKTVDDFLGRNPPAPARALFWKGQTLYLQGRDAFAAAGQLSTEAAEFFRRAQGAYEASTRASGDEPDAWIQLAYASTYLGGEDNIRTAGAAYRKAALLDANDKAPFEGLKSLYTHDPAQYRAALKEILAAQPEHAWTIWYHAVDRYTAQDWDAARKAFERYAGLAAEPAQGHYFAGVCADQAGDGAAAERLYYAALAADPNHAQAAAAIEKRLMASGVETKARQSPAAALAVHAQYKPLLKAAPNMAWLRNNLAFILREAYVGGAQGGGARAWLPVLKASTEVYTEAAGILGEWTAEKERSLTWAQRYGEAQIISDTGLMYQFYEPTRDYETAEMYYERALEYTDDGYRDAYNNLARILAEQERWQELYDLAAACAEGIRHESGEPDQATREAARAVAQKLLSSGRATDG